MRARFKYWHSSHFGHLFIAAIARHRVHLPSQCEIPSWIERSPDRLALGQRSCHSSRVQVEHATDHSHRPVQDPVPHRAHPRSSRYAERSCTVGFGRHDLRPGRLVSRQCFSRARLRTLYREETPLVIYCNSSPCHLLAPCFAGTPARYRGHWPFDALLDIARLNLSCSKRPSQSIFLSFLC